MKNIPSLLLALYIAASVAACGGGGDASTFTPGSFEMDRFFSEIIDRTPRGLVTTTTVETRDPRSTVGTFVLQTRFSTDPVDASEITLTLPRPYGDSSVQIRNVGRAVYFLTVLLGEETGWVQLQPDAQGNDPLGGFGIANVLLVLDPDEFNPDDWVPAGQTRCRNSDCFVLDNDNDTGSRLHVHKITYAPMQLILNRAVADDNAPPVIIEISDWDQPADIETPTGAMPLATDDQLEAAVREVFATAGVTE